MRAPRLSLFVLAPALFGSAFLSAPVAAFAAGPAAQQKSAQQQASQPRPRLPAPARLARPTARVVAWGEHKVIVKAPPQPRPDPFRIEGQGYAQGTELALYVQAPSQPIELPATAASQQAQATATSSRAFGRAMARAVRGAQQRTLVKAGTVDLTATPARYPGTLDAVPAGTAFLEEPAPLPTGTPFELEGKHPDGRRYPVARGHVVGLPEQRSYGQDSMDYVQTRFYPGHAQYTSKPAKWPVGERYQLVKSGKLAPAGKPWVQEKNLLATSTYERDGKSYFKLLGLAAFPRGARVTVYNETRAKNAQYPAVAEFEADQAVARAKGTPRLNRTGSGSIEVPALAGDVIKVFVKLPADANAMKTTVAGHEHEPVVAASFKVPSGGAPVMEKKGLKYYAIAN